MTQSTTTPSGIYRIVEFGNRSRDLGIALITVAPITPNPAREIMVRDIFDLIDTIMPAHTNGDPIYVMIDTVDNVSTLRFRANIFTPENTTTPPSLQEISVALDGVMTPLSSAKSQVW